MRLHRIALTDFRGVTSSEVAFGAPGITVVVGPNEIGKSSLAEALRLIRTFKDSSRHRDVVAVKPTHRDVGPQVMIEVETGDHRFVYTKRWLKKASTELSITAPRPEQLTGDEAHDRVEQIFAATLDPELWSALQQVQGESLQQAALARVAPLQSALSARSESGEVDEAHADLMERIEAEYRRYFTRTGTPTGEHAGSAREVEALRDEVEIGRAALRAVAETVERHERLTAQREVLRERVSTTAADLESLEERHQSVAALRREHEQACGRLREAELATQAARAALDARHERVSAARDLRVRADAAHAVVVEAGRRHDAARAALDEIEAAGTTGRQQIEAARLAVNQATVRVEQARRAVELTALRSRLQVVDEATARLEAVEALVARHVVDDDTLRELTDAHADLQAARASATSGAARVTVERLSGAVVTLDGESVDDPRTVDVTREVHVEVPGVLRVVVVPDHAASARADQAEGLEQQLAERFRQLGVADLTGARADAAARREAEADRDRARIERDAALAGQSRESLHGALAALVQLMGDDAAQPDGDLDDLERQLAAARDDLTAAEASAHDDVSRRETCVAAERAASDARTKAVASAEGLEDEAARAEARLTLDREATDDEVLAQAVTSADEAVTAATDAVETAERALAEHGADALQIELDNARPLRDRAVTELQANDRELAAVEAELEVRGRDGLQDRLDAALSALDDAERRRASLAARAAAAELLHSTMTSHQAAAQQRYVGPFKAAIEDLGAVVFGAGFEVEVGDDLSIVSRTVDGVTVPFESLSGGAREQLAVIGRLATAQLVSAGDGAPVILDDSLGFSDAARRAKLAAVLNLVGASAQIIILTCEPDRFAGIGNAVTVSLG